MRDTEKEQGVSAKWFARTTCVMLLVFGTFAAAFYSAAGSNSEQHARAVKTLADARLNDQNGKRITSSDLRGKLVMMNFFFTACGNACPVQTAVLREVQQQLDPKLDVLFLSISIAPLTDTHRAVHEYISKFDVKTPDWKFATASLANTEALIEHFGVTVDGAIVEEGRLDHRNMGYLFSKEGVLMQQYQLVPGAGKRLVREITELHGLELQSS